jgi:protein TonB
MPPPAAGIAGVVGGVPGGVAGGQIGGVIGGIISSAPQVAPPPPPPPVEKKVAAPKRIRVGGSVQKARLARRVQPQYPPLARQARIQGTVMLTAIIARDGSVQSLEVVSGHPLLVPSAMQAVKQWLYKPTLLNGEPVEVVTQIEVNFRLSG